MNVEPVLDLQTAPAGPAARQLARLHHYFERQCDSTPAATALICGEERFTYADLDALANRLAHYLVIRGVGSGDRVGILLERSAHLYAALLAIMKSGAAFVPLDPSFPAERVAFIAADANLAVLMTTSGFPAASMNIALVLDEVEILAMPSHRPELAAHGDPLAYIIYTSGTTGHPKGVAIHHSNICFFLNACTPIYGIAASDRVYQGMTLAFDFSIEEIWPTWIAGATLVAGPEDERRIGSGLERFLRENAVTALYCVPTLLATLDAVIPSLRTLIVGGEACPQELADRWAPRVRRMLNTYGPTETTVTASWTELAPGLPVSIGRPMPGYWIHILDDELRPVPNGDPGEICIGGPGVARGYWKRPELTAARFVTDPLEPGGRLYRSGDLGRFAENGEIEFVGRIDTQAKVRGFRMELGEIEAVLLEDVGVANVAVVALGAPASHLAAYVTLRNETAGLSKIRERLADRMRGRLPGYMLPTYLEVLDAMPSLASGKTDRAHLPPPVLPPIAARNAGIHVEPATSTEHAIADVWRAIFSSHEISVEADFFLDLGGHSLFAARAVSQLRGQPALAHISIADLYRCPSIRGLAKQLETTAPATQPARAPALAHSAMRVWTAGVVQGLLLYVVLAILATPGAWLLARHRHSAMGFTAWDFAIPALVLVLSLLLPIALKWTLIGRFRPGTYPLWGWFYCRLWLVRKSIEWSPLHHLAGSPLLAVYARLLGASIGNNCHVGTAQLSLPDLIRNRGWREHRL